MKHKRRGAGLKRPRSLRVIQQDESVLPRIQALKAEHPFWGYRRVWASRHCIENLTVNKKRTLRLMREHHLVVPPNLRLKAKRTAIHHQPKPTKPNEWGGIARTKVVVEGFGWGYIVVILDWYAKKIVGYYAGMQCAARHWLAAWALAVSRQFPAGARGQGLSLMRDKGCQPTAAAFRRACATLESHQACTSYNKPKGHADTERFMRTLKEECLWWREWTCPCELITAFEAWIITYNEQY